MVQKNVILLILTLFTGLVTSPVSGQTKITRVSFPREVTAEVVNLRGAPEELKGLQWNQWTSKNFVAISLDDAYAHYLYEHLEDVKVWAYSRWGLPDVEFSSKCTVICVRNPRLFDKLFRLKKTKVDIRYNSDGTISENVLFILANGPPSETIPIPLTEVCLAEFSQKHNLKMGHWANRGMICLNGSIGQIKDQIHEVEPLFSKNEPLFFSRGLLEMTSEQYNALNRSQQRTFDNCSTIFCLMIRKELGQDNFLQFLEESTGENKEQALKSSLGFTSYSEFDAVFKRYIDGLTSDIVEGVTPDSYLQIREKGI